MTAVRRFFSYSYVIICFIVFAFTFCCSMAYSIKCYANFKIVIGSFLCALLFLGLYVGFTLVSRFKKFLNLFVFLSFFLFVSLCLFLNLTCKSDFYSIIDYGFVVDAAEEYAQIGSDFDYSYFTLYTNNLPMFFTLTGLIKISNFLHIQDYYVVFAIIATMIEAVTMLSCAYLAYEHKKNICDAAMSVMILGSFLPMYPLMPLLYTDMLTFGIIPATFALIRMAANTQVKAKAFLLKILAGILLAYGIQMKITLLIPLIASVIIIILSRKRLKIWVTVLTCVICLLSGKRFLQSHEFVRECQKTSNPTSSWILIGMSEDGSFAHAYPQYLKEMYQHCNTTAEKDAYCKSIIKENWKILFNYSHVIKKTFRVYGLNDFGITEYDVTASEGYENNLIQRCFNKYGKPYHHALNMSSMHLGAIMIIYLMGLVIEFIRLIQKRENTPFVDLINMSFVGYFFYLMLSETSSHQIFNLMPLMFIGTALHLNCIKQFIATTWQGIRTRHENRA